MNNLNNSSLQNRILSNLGLANRAGKVVAGDMLRKALRQNLVVMLFIAKDASVKTKERFNKSAQFKDIPVNQDFTSEQLSMAIGKVNRMVLGITDHRFLKILK